MNTTAIKLTDFQNKELQEIAKALNSNYQIEKIICFAAHSSAVSSDTVFATPGAASANTYHLLVLTTEATRIEHAIQDYITKLFPGTLVISHGQETVMNLVYKHNRFFLNACLNGALIYTADGFTMIPEFEMEKAEAAASGDRSEFGRIYNLASGFMESAFNCYEDNFLNNVVFLLHQAVEHACRALIRLFTGYHSDVHNLDRLLQLCNCFSEEPALFFRRHFKDEQRLFRILSASYSEARYKDHYTVESTEAQQLCTLVKTFLDLVSELAEKEIQQGETKSIYKE